MMLDLQFVMMNENTSIKAIIVYLIYDMEDRINGMISMFFGRWIYIERLSWIDDKERNSAMNKWRFANNTADRNIFRNYYFGYIYVDVI